MAGLWKPTGDVPAPENTSHCLSLLDTGETKSEVQKGKYTDLFIRWREGTFLRTFLVMQESLFKHLSCSIAQV